MAMSTKMKIDRALIHAKYDGRCAYCGTEITVKQMQVDHIQPHWHTVTEEEALRCGIKKGSHDVENLNPSCARCNRWKSTWTLEQFRNQVQTSINRLTRDTPNFNLALDYGLIEIKPITVKFYFEK
jgi:5-methylcytosine-specific restriction endonuclease McrA